MVAERAVETMHVADSHDYIRVTGARENNLKEVSVEIPKRRLTVFTGVSGSGKSSLVFDTIAAESQRLINETYSAFVRPDRLGPTALSGQRCPLPSEPAAPVPAIRRPRASHEEQVLWGCYALSAARRSAPRMGIRISMASARSTPVGRA